MTRSERDAEVKRLAGNLGLTARTGHSPRYWFVWHDEDYRGTLDFNEKSERFRVYGGRLSKAHYGELGGLLNLLACSGVH